MRLNKRGDNVDGFIIFIMIAFIVVPVIYLIYRSTKDISKAVSNSQNEKQKEKRYFEELEKNRSEYDRLYKEYLANEKEELNKFLEKEELIKHCLICESKRTAYGYTRKERWYVALSADEDALYIIKQYGPISPQYSRSDCTVCAPRPATFKFIEGWSMESLLYFKLDGDVQYTANVNGGGANLKGAVAGAIIAGGAGAVIGSRNAVSTETIKHDDRAFIVACDGEEDFITKENPLEYYNAFMKIIPQKEVSVYMKSSTPDVAVEKIDSNELVKLKELLDSGIITQEEFDAKKKQILGL